LLTYYSLAFKIAAQSLYFFCILIVLDWTLNCDHNQRLVNFMHTSVRVYDFLTLDLYD